MTEKNLQWFKHIVVAIAICTLTTNISAQEDFILDYDLSSDAPHFLTSDKMFYLTFRLPYCSNFELTEIGAHIDATSGSGVVKFALFDKDRNVLWQSGEVSVTGGVDEYVSVDITQGDIVLDDMTFYFIGMIGNPDDGDIMVRKRVDPVNNGVGINCSTSTIGQYKNVAYPDFPDPATIDIAWYGAVNMVAKGVPAPVTITPNVTDLPALTGECVTATAPTAVASCGGTISATTSDPTEYTEDGTYTITWVYKEGYYYAVEQTQTVIVDDVTDPDIPTLPEIHVDYASVITPPTTTDACVGIVSGTTTDPTEFSAEGKYTITWTFDDGNGNSVQADQIVSVVETQEALILDYDLGSDAPHPLTSAKMFYLNFRLP
ncbi:MAG: hypothetical protein ABFS10_09890, partial [Bacteroidota bacterium]